MAEATFWNDQEKAQAVVQQVKTYKQWIEPFDTARARCVGCA